MQIRIMILTKASVYYNDGYHQEKPKLVVPLIMMHVQAGQSTMVTVTAV